MSESAQTVDLVVVESHYGYRLLAEYGPSEFFGFDELKRLYTPDSARLQFVVAKVDGSGKRVVRVENPAWEDRIEGLLAILAPKRPKSLQIAAFATGKPMALREVLAVANLAQSFCVVHGTSDVVNLQFGDLRVAKLELDEEGG